MSVCIVMLHISPLILVIDGPQIMEAFSTHLPVNCVDVSCYCSPGSSSVRISSF